MARLAYETAETLVFDPVAANRNATRASLYSLGFRQIETVATLETLTGYVRQRMPDLLVCEASGSADELCGIIQSLRHGELCQNPFIVVIVTTWEKSTGLVNRVINSGADDLVVRPFSTAILGARIAVHVERRKGFVITSDYIGPDRRRDPNRPDSAPLFAPPNSLKIKVKDGLSADAAQMLIAEELGPARESLKSKKMGRDAFQICIQWRLLQQFVPAQREFADGLARIQAISASVLKRARGTEQEDQVEERHEAILSAVKGLQTGVDSNASMHMLGHAVLSLNLYLDPGKGEAEQLAEIDATIAKINARQSQTRGQAEPETEAQADETAEALAS